MKICRHCGVELDADMNFCPLCGQPSTISNGMKMGYKSTSVQQADSPEDFNFEELNDRQKRRLVWEVTAFIITMCTIVTLIIDLMVSKHITWSKYTLSIGLVLLADVSMLVFLRKHLYMLLTGCFASTSALLVVLDLFNHNLDGGIKLGIPILFFIFLVLFVLFILIRKAKSKGLNVIAYSLVAAGIICMGIEGIISIHIAGMLQWTWSFVVLVSVLPVSVVLLYVHFRLKKATDLRKLFHI